MPVLKAMDIVYPVLFGLLIGQFFIKLAYHWFVRRNLAVLSPPLLRLVNLIIIIDALIALNEALIVGTLAVNTGEKPMFDINQYRYIVVILRSLLSVLLLVSISLQTTAIYVFWKLYHDVGTTTRRADPLVREIRQIPFAGFITQR